MTSPATKPASHFGIADLRVRSAAMTKSQADMIPAPPATAAPCTVAIVTSRVLTSASNVRATISAVACAFVLSAAVLQIQAGAKRLAGSAQNQDALLRDPRRFVRSPPISSLINSIVSALRRSGRLSVTRVICGCLFFDENDWHELSYAVSNIRHDGIRQAHRMSARRLAGAARAKFPPSGRWNICAGWWRLASGISMR